MNQAFLDELKKRGHNSSAPKIEDEINNDKMMAAGHNDAADKLKVDNEEKKRKEKERLSNAFKSFGNIKFKKYEIPNYVKGTKVEKIGVL